MGISITEIDHEDLLRECDTNFELSRSLIEKFSPSRKNYNAKDVIYSIGGESDCVFYILKGMVKLVSDLPNGNSRIVRLHNLGSWLGLGRLLDEPYEHTAIALDEAVLLQFKADHIKRLRKNEPEIYARFLEYWFEYLNKADLWITEFSTGSLKARLARLLTFMDNLEPDKGEARIRLLTCEEIAQILGATTESVSRLLAKFKRDDVIVPSEESGIFQISSSELRQLSDE